MKFQFTSSDIYDKLKWLAQIGLPTLAGAYFAISQIWGLPATDEVIGTISVVDAALGGLLGLSSKNYVPPADGHVLIDNSNPDHTNLHVQVDKDPHDIVPGDNFLLRVVEHPDAKPQIPAPPSPHQI